MIAIIDYGMGNLRSVQKALAFLQIESQIVSSPAELCAAAPSHVILPGVGAFPDAMARLRESGMDDALRAAVQEGLPLLGICLGMQMLLESSTEGGLHQGLGFLEGEITRFDISERVPHVGWNTVRQARSCPLLEGVDGQYFYFVHSYCAANPSLPVCGGITEYEKPFTSVVWKDNVFGTQFHPEKSGEAGLTLLRNFAALPSPLR